MEPLEIITNTIFIIVGVILILILGIAIKRYINSKNTPAEKTSLLFLLLGIVGFIYLILFMASKFLAPGSIEDQIITRIHSVVLVTIPFVFVLFAVQTEFGNLLNTGRYYTIAAITTYTFAAMVAAIYATSFFLARIFYYGFSIACITPSIYLWIKLVKAARIDPTMDTLKFIFYLIGFSFLDTYYIQNFLVTIINNDAWLTSLVQIQFFNSIFVLGLVVFTIIAQFRSKSSSS
ncbi:MAG: hypothetical protein ACFFD2_09105 [Promethearchaeota archaeon]